MRLSCTARWEFDDDELQIGEARIKPLRCHDGSMAGQLLAAVPPSCTALHISEALVTPIAEVGDSPENAPWRWKGTGYW